MVDCVINFIKLKNSEGSRYHKYKWQYVQTLIVRDASVLLGFV